MAQWLIFAGAALIGFLGTMHLIYTFTSNKFDSRDETLNRMMKETPLQITRQTTMWRAWIGFNASHGLGAMLFGLIYGYLALTALELLTGSWFLMGLSILFLITFIVLAKRYWFVVPLRGITLACLLIVSGYALAVF